MTQSLTRESVARIDPYIPGKAIEDVKRELGLEEIIRLASNENPFGPSEKAVEAMRQAVLDSHLYPEGTCQELREKLADRYAIDPEQIVVGNGADNTITLIGNAYINPGDEVVYCTPTFSAYRKITLLMGGVPIELATTEKYVFDLDAILAAVTHKTKLIFICNPNNPTGTIVEQEKMVTFLQQLPKHVIVVMDEAYVEFIQSESYRSGIDFVKEGYPVIAVRTFSKLYGLAGLRIGYAVASKEHIFPVQVVREPFAASRIAHAAAVAALDDTPYVDMILQENKREMARLTGEFQLLGYDVTESHANFLFVDFKRDSTEMFKALLKKGLIIRPCTAWGLETHARITIGSSQQNERLLEALREVNGQIPEHPGKGARV